MKIGKRKIRTTVWLAGGCALAVWGAPVLAGGLDLPTGISRLLDPISEPARSFEASAPQQYEQLKQRFPNDRRLDYAYSLTLIGQRKYREALPLVSRYLEGGRGEPHAYCTKIWVLLQDRHHQDALNEAVTLSDRFPQGASSPEGRYYEAAEFLGTVFAFLELARPAAIAPARRLEYKNRVLARLGRAYTPAFHQARSAVVGQLAEMHGKNESIQRGLAAKSEERKGRTQASLDADRRRLLDAEETQQASTSQLLDAQRSLQQTQQELATLNHDRAQVGAKIAMLQAQISMILAPTTIDQRTDPTLPTIQVTAPPPAGDTRTLRAMALAMTMAGLSRQALGMDRKILAYQARIAELAGKGEQELDSLAESAAELEATQRRAKKAEYQLNRGNKPTAVRSGVLSEKMSTFSTYSPFPYAQERKRVLSWFAK